MFPALRPVRNAADRPEALVEVLEAAISFALDFDLYVPPYSVSKLVTVEQFNSRNELSKLHTGKRLGYEFECEDK